MDGEQNGTQTQQEFEDVARSLHIDGVNTCGIKRTGYPRPQPPLYIADVNAAEGNVRRLSAQKPVGKCELLKRFGIYVRPPFPRRDTKQTRKLHQSIGCAKGIAARNDELTRSVDGKDKGLGELGQCRAGV